MNRLTKIIASILAILIATSTISCKKDDTLYYNNMTMGNVYNGQFISDNGNAFNIVEQNCTGNIGDMKRVIVICDILKKTAENTYDIRLNQLSPVLTKDPVAVADATEGDYVATDPVSLRQVWYSGGYLNMYITVPVIIGSSTKHFINLIYNKNSDNSYTFELRHNAFGELMDENSSNIYMEESYVSFPILEIVDSEYAEFDIVWKWYESAGYGWSTSIKDYKSEYEWKREGYEHITQSFSLDSSTMIL